MVNDVHSLARGNPQRMYLNHYQLRARPFSLSPSPGSLWLGEKHSEALAILKYGVGSDMGFLLMTGDVGVGKTALIHRLISTMDDSTHLAYITDPSVSINDFFQLLSAEFKIAGNFHGKAHFLIQLEEFLHQAYREKKRVLLIIDEAQRLRDKLLDEIRVLSNIELSDKKLLTIFLVGQPEFIQLISTNKNRAIRQRIAIKCHIQPLDEKETGQYIQHRLQAVGASGPIFKPDAIHEIFRITGGYPRAINILCDHALVEGYVSDRQTIDAEAVRACEDGFQIQPTMEYRSPKKPPTMEYRSPDKPPLTKTETPPVKRSWLASNAVSLVSGFCIAFICFAAVYLWWLEPQIGIQDKSPTVIETPAQKMLDKVTPPVTPSGGDTTAQASNTTASDTADTKPEEPLRIARARPTDPLQEEQQPVDNRTVPPTAPTPSVDPESQQEWGHWPQTDQSSERPALNDARDSEDPMGDVNPATAVRPDPAATDRQNETPAINTEMGASVADTEPATSRPETGPQEPTAAGLESDLTSPADIATSENGAGSPPTPQIGEQAPSASGTDGNITDKQSQSATIEPEPISPATTRNLDDDGSESTEPDDQSVLATIAGSAPSPGPTATLQPTDPTPAASPATSAAATRATGQPSPTADTQTGPSSPPSQQSPSGTPTQASPLAAAADQSPSAVTTEIAAADDATTPAANRPVEARIRSFLEAYTDTYAAKDLERFARFFTASAIENGKPFSTLLSKYERNFTFIETIEYRIELQRFSLTDSRELVQIEGNFFLRWLPRDNRWRENSGTITMQLKEDGSSFLVQRLDYQGGRPPKN